MKEKKPIVITTKCDISKLSLSKAIIDEKDVMETVRHRLIEMFKTQLDELSTYDILDVEDNVETVHYTLRIEVLSGLKYKGKCES